MNWTGAEGGGQLQRQPAVAAGGGGEEHLLQLGGAQADHVHAGRLRGADRGAEHGAAAGGPEMGNWAIGNWKLIESTAITNYIW